jgi:hypothetical protein
VEGLEVWCACGREVSSIYVGGQTENVFAFVFAFRLPILYARQTTAALTGDIFRFVVAAGGLNLVVISMLL